jgi:hypothetical protein
MPVFRVEATASVITAEQRGRVIDQFTRELSGETTPDGPVIFEIPFERSDKFDVLVVWDAWGPFSSEDRSSIILGAYKEQRAKIAQALGVTFQEAIEQQLLPYAVIPMVRPGEVDPEELKKTMVAEGGRTLASSKVDLRFPTMALAEQAHRRLSDKLPKGYWSIVQTVASIPS